MPSFSMVKTAADFANFVQERDHVFLLGIQNFNAAIAGNSGSGERSGFDNDR
jgi:hypothetical protein